MAKRIVGTPDTVGPDAGLPPIMGSEAMPRQEVTLPDDMGTVAPQAASEAASPDLVDAASTIAPADDTSRKLRLGFDTGGFGWALGSQDFNPAGYKPTESRSAGVGKYGGAPIYAAPLAFPNSVIASRLQAIQKEDDALDAAIAKLGEGYTDVNNPKYSDRFHRWANAELRSAIQSAKAIWGEKEGMRRLLTPGTEEYEAFHTTKESINTVAKGINQGTGDALAVMKGISDGTIQNTPGLYEAAKGFHDAVGNTANMSAPDVAKAYNRFDQHRSFNKAIQDDKVLDALKNAASTEDLVTRIKAGDPLYASNFVSYLNTKRKSVSEAAIETLTDKYAQEFPDMPREVIRANIAAMVPNDLEQKITSHQRHAPSGSNGSGASKYVPQSAYDKNAAVFPTGTIRAASGEEAAFTLNSSGGEVSRPYMSLMTYTQSGGKLATPNVFHDGSARVYMSPEGVYNVNGEGWIVGSQTGMPRTRAQKDKFKEYASGMLSAEDIEKALNATDESQLTPEAAAAIDRFNELQKVAVPLTPANEKMLTNAYGVDVPRMRTSIELEGYGKGDKPKEQMPFVPDAVAQMAGGNKAKDNDPPVSQRPKNGEARADGARWSDKYGAYVMKGSDGKYRIVD